MHDDNSILRNPELWLAALVGCGPAVLIAALMNAGSGCAQGHSSTASALVLCVIRPGCPERPASAGPLFAGVSPDLRGPAVLARPRINSA